MVLITRCCCWKNVRSGSFAAGFYTLILHTVILTGGAFNLNTVMDTIPMLVLSLLMLACSGCCVITSVLLLIGLCVDSRMLLIPWMISVFTTTLLDILVSLYLLIEADFSKFLAVLFSIDIFICALNVYCLLCVYSQYQEYVAGRGYPCTGHQQTPQVEYRNDRCFLPGSSRITNDSNATNSSSISVVQSSVPPGQSEDLQGRCHDGDSCESRDPILPDESENLMTAVPNSTDRIIERIEASFVSNEKELTENSDSGVSQVVEYFNDSDERALKA